jgi:hypothetical protein
MNDSHKPWISSRIGFSSFGVLVYYAIATASAWTLTPAEGRPARIVPVVGLAGNVIMAFALPVSSVLTGAAVLALGVTAYGLRRTVAAKGRSPYGGLSLRRPAVSLEVATRAHTVHRKLSVKNTPRM